MEKFIPGETYEITKEAQEASLLELKEQVGANPDLIFTLKLLERNPNIRIALVGGIVRDAILGLPSKDYDFVVENTSLDELENFLKEYGKTVLVEGRAYGVLKFKPHGSKEIIDIALPRTEKYEPGKRASDAEVQTENIAIEDDFSRRDFTMNAIGLDIKTGEAIDPFCGLEDISKRTVRAVGNPVDRFKEDPTRILRGIRFACRYNFDIEQNTMQAMVQEKEEIFKTFINKSGQEVTRVSAEKIGEELIKTTVANPEKFIEYYDKVGLLELVLPEVSELKKVEQPKQFHSEGDVFAHTKMVLRHIPQDSPPHLKIAALFHDLGKKDTFHKEGERITFHGHDKISAEKARNILSRYRFTDDFKRKVAWLIQNHMRALVDFPHMSPSKQKTLAREPLFSELALLAKADATASIKPDGTTDLNFLDSIAQAKKIIEKEQLEGRPLDIIDGNEVIAIAQEIIPEFNTQEHGILIGKIKNTINDLYHNDKIRSKKEALEQAREMLKKRKVED